MHTVLPPPPRPWQAWAMALRPASLVLAIGPVGWVRGLMRRLPRCTSGADYNALLLGVFRFKLAFAAVSSSHQAWWSGTPSLRKKKPMGHMLLKPN